MSTLTKNRILKKLKDASESGLVLTPILSDKQIGDASVDVRLGNQFIVFRSHTLGIFRPFKSHLGELKRMQQRQVVPFGTPFVLHPGKLALASTFEYVCVPCDLECQVEGRSSWARVGLQIATANSVEPGFKGVLTLELSNVGTIPLQLHPGVRIAQLIFHDAKPACGRAYGESRKYVCPIGPQFSQIADDKDGKVFAGKR